MERALGDVSPGREKPQKLMPPGAMLGEASLAVKGLAVPGCWLIGSEICQPPFPSPVLGLMGPE